MGEGDQLVQRFEANRPRLRGVAYRMLGSLSDADDAVQEAWLRLSRAGAGGVDNLDGWLTTVVARVCLDVLRSRNVRRETSLEAHIPDLVIGPDDRTTGPETEALPGRRLRAYSFLPTRTISPDSTRSLTRRLNALR